MNILDDYWVPVTSKNGIFQLITYKDLLGSEGDWSITLPRDDLELACLQLLICLTQVIFLPKNDSELRSRISSPMSPEEFSNGIALIDKNWFDLDHPSTPFMQTRGVKAKETTPIQKLLIGLPEGNNHAFFDRTGDVLNLSAACTVIALFNQASNCPSFGGGFKGSLRGGAPVTTLVMENDGNSLRKTIWRNVITLPRIRERLPDYEPDFTRDKPTWVEPIKQGTIYNTEIGLLRGLFWQPAHIELIASEGHTNCDLTGLDGPCYSGFLCEKFAYKMEGLWPHPHGIMVPSTTKGKTETKFASFTTTAPAWTHLTQFILPGDDGDAGGGITPAEPVLQATQLNRGRELHLIIGGYRTKQASVLERRHETMMLAPGWEEHSNLLIKIVDLAKGARKILANRLSEATKGDKRKEWKGIGVPFHEKSDPLFYSLTESKLLAALQDHMTFDDFKTVWDEFGKYLVQTCDEIFRKLTDPYAFTPELVPIIKSANRALKSDLRILMEGGDPNERRRKKEKKRI